MDDVTKVKVGLEVIEHYHLLSYLINKGSTIYVINALHINLDNCMVLTHI